MGRSKGIIPSFSVVLVMVALSVIGLASIPLLHIDYLPRESGQALTVSFSLRDASAEMIEAEVTSKVEAALAGIRGVMDVESVSQKGSGTVTVTFRKNVDLEKARFEMASAIRNIYPSLPEELTYPVISRKGRQRRAETAIAYTLKGDLPSHAIERYGREHLLPALSAIKEVDEVLLAGATPWQWVITFDADKALTANISASEIASAILSAREGVFLGVIETPDGKSGIRIQADSSACFGDIPVKNVNGHIIYLRDIATWEYQEAIPTYYYRINGLNAIVVSIGLVEGANLIGAVDAIQERMEELKTHFPPEITASVSYDASSFMRDELERVYRRTGLCVLILLLFVFLVSRSWRYLVIVTATLLVNILTAIGIYAFTGLPIHIYTMAGITVSLGIVIDTTIIMADHYRHRQDRKVFPAMLAATATTVGALVVVLLLPEEERANLTDFILVIAINLTLSLAIAYFFIPSLIAYIPEESSKKNTVGKRLAVRFNQAYTRYIQWGIRHRWVLILAALACFSYPAWLFYMALDRANFYRQPSRPQLYIQAAMPEGLSITQLNDVIRMMENQLAGFDGIETFTTRVSSYDNAIITVAFKPEVEAGSYPYMVKEYVTGIAKNYGGTYWSIFGLDDNYYNNSGSTVISPYRITLSGYQYQDLLSFSEKVISYMKDRSRLVTDLEIWSAGSTSRPGTEYSLLYNFQRMAFSGINPYSYHSSLARELWSSNAGTVDDKNGISRIILRSSARETNDLWHIMNAPLSGQVPLSVLGNIDKQFSDRSIYRHNQSYQVDIYYNYLGQSTQGRKLAEDVVRHMNEEVLPLGYKAESVMLGLFDTHKEQYFWLLGIILAVLGIMLAITFESHKLPWAVIGLIPISFTGLFLVFGLSNLSFDQGGFAAMVMLSGIVVNAAIYLVTSFQKAGGRNAPTREKRIRLYVKAFSYKIFPILLTVVSTILGLLPFLSDGPSEPFWFCFAAGTIGGMLISVPTLLLLLPPFIIRARD